MILRCWKVHQLPDGLFVDAVALDVLRVGALLREEDLASHVDERLDDRVAQSTVLGLHVVNALRELDVGVEAGQHVKPEF